MAYTKTVWVSSTTPAIDKINLDHMETQYSEIITIGEIKMYAGTTAPTDFFLCNGTSKNSATYPDLYAVTSHFFGGTTAWFHLPDLQGKFIAGYGSGDYATIGLTGGTSAVTMTSTELPPHQHYFTEYFAMGLGNNYGISEYQSGLALNPTSTYVTGVTGGGGAHDNVPQYVTVNYIIRYQ